MNNYIKKSLTFLFILFIPYINYTSDAIGMEDLNCEHCGGTRSVCLTLKENGKGASGKWLDNVTPKRGWTCTGAEDLGVGETERCQMCEREDVRYIHHMKHGNNNPLNLNVGCICSAYMDGTLDTQQSFLQAKQRAERRTSDLVNRAQNRLNFPNLKGWKISQKNNPYIKKDNKIITIIKSKYNKYCATIDNNSTNQWKDSIDEAKLVAFDYLYPAIIN
jgi:hypothetical protein